MRTSTLEKFDLAPTYFDNRYEVFSTIGRGRGSVVYRARRFSPDETLDLTIPPIALKVLIGIEKDPEAAIRRIKREALALLSCKSPSVIRIFDYVAREDTCYLTMEYAKYSDLRRLFEDGRPDLSTAAILKLVQGILDGVRSVHEVGIIHRDLKLENFLLTEDFKVKVADFGVCLLKGERPDIQVVNEVVGTFDYTAPECLKGGKYSNASDLYSIGVSAFEMLSGRLPTLGTTIKEMLEDKSAGRIRNLPKDVLDRYPSLAYFFEKALHPDPESRFQSADQMSDAITSVLEGTYKKERVFSFTGIKGTIFSSPGTFLVRKISGIPFVASILETIHEKLSACIKFLQLSLAYALVFVGLFLLKDLVYDPFVSSEKFVTEDAPYEFFSSVSGVGRIFDLYSEGRDYRFTLLPSEPGKGFFSLSRAGWEQVVVSYEPLLEGKGIEVKGEGVDIILIPELFSSGRVTGTYVNNLTGDSGNWSMVVAERDER
jgi:serine/threonine protein kinase